MKHKTTSMSEDGLTAVSAASRPKEALTVRVDDEGMHIQTRRQAIRQAQAVVKKFTNARTGSVQRFLNERREEFVSTNVIFSEKSRRS